MDNVDPKDIVKVIQDYTGYITSVCRKYYLVDGTPEDLFQECIIGLLKACKSYKGESLFEPKFDAFAKRCIHSQIVDSLRHSNALKNKALNEAKTIYAVNENGDEMQTLDIIPDRTTVNDPLEIILEKEKELQAKKTEEIKTKLLKHIGCGFGVGLSWGSVYFETDKIVCSNLIEL